MLNSSPKILAMCFSRLKLILRYRKLTPPGLCVCEIDIVNGQFVFFNILPDAFSGSIERIFVLFRHIYSCRTDISRKCDITLQDIQVHMDYSSIKTKAYLNVVRNLFAKWKRT